MKICKTCNRKIGRAEDGCPDCGGDLIEAPADSSRADHEDGFTRPPHAIHLAPELPSNIRRNREIED